MGRVVPTGARQGSGLRRVGLGLCRPTAPRRSAQNPSQDSDTEKTRGRGALRAFVRRVLRESCSRASRPRRRGTLGGDPGRGPWAGPLGLDGRREAGGRRTLVAQLHRGPHARHLLSHRNRNRPGPRRDGRWAVCSSEHPGDPKGADAWETLTEASSQRHGLGWRARGPSRGRLCLLGCPGQSCGPGARRPRCAGQASTPRAGGPHPAPGFAARVVSEDALSCAPGSQLRGSWPAFFFFNGMK